MICQYSEGSGAARRVLIATYLLSEMNDVSIPRVSLLAARARTRNSRLHSNEETELWRQKIPQTIE